MPWMRNHRAADGQSECWRASRAVLLVMLIASSMSADAIDMPALSVRHLRLLQASVTSTQLDVYIRPENGAGDTESRQISG